MTIDKIRDENLQCAVNREAAEISALSSEKNDKYEYLIGEEILPSNRRQIKEKAEFAYSHWRKALEKQTEKHVGALKSLDFSHKNNELKQIGGIFPLNLMINLIFVKLNKIVNLQDITKTDNQNYKSSRGKTCNFDEYSLPIDL